MPNCIDEVFVGKTFPKVFYFSCIFYSIYLILQLFYRFVLNMRTHIDYPININSSTKNLLVLQFFLQVYGQAPNVFLIISNVPKMFSFISGGIIQVSSIINVPVSIYLYLIKRNFALD